MGILPEGQPLSWQETKALSKHVQKHGVQQFINLYRKSKDRPRDPFKWGDEMEYMIMKFNHDKKEAKVSCKSKELLTILNEREERNKCNGIWRPEFGSFQIESSPLKPYEGSFEHLKLVEHNMRVRRAEVEELLEEDECLITLVNSLHYGCKDFTYPSYATRPEDLDNYLKSLYIPDGAIFDDHPRYHVLTRNILMRRGERMQNKINVFRDEHTKFPIEGSPIKEPEVVVLDVCLGSNLQVTVQGADMFEACYLYDQLAPLCPIIQAITAALPIYRGYLCDIDNSYYFIGGGSDDRTQEERGLKPLKNDKCRIKKLRWDSIDAYLTPEAEIYNDIDLYYDQELYDQMRNEGVDHMMAQHVAHLFMRDPLILFSNNLDQNDEVDTGHFDNINTSTWQTLRFKPALPNSDLGWRVEFRPVDVQLTDFENAAVSCFVILLTRAVLHYRLNFLMPISKMDENMAIAQKRDACRKEKLWFRTNILRSAKQIHDCGNGNTNNLSNGNGHSSNNKNKIDSNGHSGFHIGNDYLKQNSFENGRNGDFSNKEFELMSIEEIFNGKSQTCPGLIPLVRSYLKTIDLDNETQCLLEKYLSFIEKRSTGETLTNAMWLREQVHNHPEYKKDSVVTERINYDILMKIKEIQDRELIEAKLFK